MEDSNLIKMAKEIRKSLSEKEDAPLFKKVAHTRLAIGLSFLNSMK